MELGGATRECYTSMRAIIADDHPMCREASRIALKAVVPDVEIVDAATLADVIPYAAMADLVVLDLALPDSRGLLSLLDVARAAPNTPILVVSGSEQPAIEAQMEIHGAAGFVSKMAPLTELIEAIRIVVDGGRWFSADLAVPGLPEHSAIRVATLSPAERRVLNAMRSGALNKQLAYDMSLSEITVKQHVKAILRKLDVVNRTQAVLALHAAEQGPKTPL